MKVQKTKFIFVTGGVYSSLGKGITASSIGRILKQLGYKVAMQKLDPYLNINPANISPVQHGEVYITEDGLQTDLDLGNYERFIDLSLNKYASLTSGRIYSEVLKKERSNEYGGKTIQVIPHITDHIIEKFKRLAKTTNAEFIIVEIGGTVGDIESIPFFETMSIFAYQYGKQNVMFTHCVPLITLDTVYGEVKTKPAQHSLRTLRSLGIFPDLVLLRTSTEVDKSVTKKLSWLSTIDEKKFFIAPNLNSTYLLPEYLFNQGIHKAIFKYFQISKYKANLNEWLDFTKTIIKPKKHKLVLGIVGEYVELHDAYFSVIEAAKLTSYALDTEILFEWIQIADLTGKNIAKTLNGIDLFIVSGGDLQLKNKYDLFFNYAYENDLLVLSYASGFMFMANSFGWSIKSYFNILTKPNLGARESKILDSNLQKAYQADVLKERHQHHFELLLKTIQNNDQNPKFTVVAQTNVFVDAFKVNGKTYQYGVNFNPEFTARPLKPNPVYLDFFKAALKRKAK